MLNENIVKNDLFDYSNRFIYQEKNGFKFSLDSILLAEFVNVKRNKTYLDMCTGNAPIPLILSTKTSDEIIGFEIQEEVYELAQKSIQVNNLEKQIKIYNNDIREIPKIFPGKYFDVIICNPPYFKYTNVKELNKCDIKTKARHEVTIDLATIFQIVGTILKDNGTFYLVHRPERLDEIIIEATKNKLSLKVLQPIATKENELKIVLLAFQKHGKSGIKINKIINVNNLTSYQHLFKED